MRFGISIVIGSATLFIGVPRCEFSLGRRGRPSRKPRTKSGETSRELTTRSAKPTAGNTTATTPTFQLDPVVRQNSIDALVTLGFPKRQAQARVNAVTVGSSTEAVIKAALRGGR